jgi:FkbM family methyltransferase
MVLKRILRPLVFRVRQLRLRLSRLIRPWKQWNGEHHPVLAMFPPWQGATDGTWVYDSLGVRTDPRYRIQFRSQPTGTVATEHPAPHAQYFELVFVLEAVADAAGDRPFVMLELGAGYGAWSAIAARAARVLNLPGVSMTGVEMVPQYCKWFGEHLENNGAARESYNTIHAAVSDLDGEAAFTPSNKPEDAFGLSIQHRDTTVSTAGSNLVSIPCVSLPTLLRDSALVDLVHCDIQGQEKVVFTESMGLVSEKVKRLLISTHSASIHRQLRTLLQTAGFEIQFDFGVRSRATTDFGDVQFLDGLLCARNPNLPTTSS